MKEDTKQQTMKDRYRNGGMNMFEQLDPKDLQIKPVEMFGSDWMALTAGNEEEGYNAMTIAWGQIGTLWERETHANRLPVATCFVRPSRYTKTFIDREQSFTLCLLPKEHKKALGILGSRSGRDGNKIAEAGLTPVFDGKMTYFKESELVLFCHVLYHAPLLEEGFTDRDLVDFNYPKRDFHTMYVGEIVKAYRKKAD